MFAAVEKVRSVGPIGSKFRFQSARKADRDAVEAEIAEKAFEGAVHYTHKCLGLVLGVGGWKA